ncbi:hypothetical protein ACFUMH_04995 [Cellulomonas sp. NPDC057328]|uniref:hypothetical protein n=1 Tax=Cellulomonas sp. NPDC057328 TaxID=3346101 RepID=UPI003626F427
MSRKGCAAVRKTSGLALVGAALLLAACAPASSSTPLGDDGRAPTVTAAPTPEAGAPGPTPAAAEPVTGESADVDWCADPAVAARVDAGLASDTEGLHNGMLASPEELAELGHTEAEIESQTRAWQSLSAEEAAFQQCLRVRQGEATVERMPGARW